LVHGGGPEGLAVDDGVRLLRLSLIEVLRIAVPRRTAEASAT